jgi:hypothetical protein
MNTMTYADAIDRVGVSLPEHLVADAEVPVLTGPQAQGDIGIIPAALLGVTDTKDHTFTPVGAGVQVVTGEATGNTHWLHSDHPGVAWARLDRDLLIGLVYVPAGAAAYLIHTDEHGANGIGPGLYALTGKREQADQIRRVTD